MPSPDVVLSHPVRTAIGICNGTLQLEGVVMKRKTHLMSKVVIVAALAAGAVGVANADMGRFDPSYVYFFSQPVDKAPSAWRKDHPNGVSEQQLQADSASSASSAWKIDKPTLDNAPS